MIRIIFNVVGVFITLALESDMNAVVSHNHTNVSRALKYLQHGDDTTRTGLVGPTRRQHGGLSDDLSECTAFDIWNNSKDFVSSCIEDSDPSFITFAVFFTKTVKEVHLPQTFKPKVWFWTYESRQVKYPYLT